MNQPNRTGNLAIYLFLYIPVVWAALLIAQSLGGSLPDILANLTAALESPFRIRWTQHSLMSILICTGAYIMALSFLTANQGRTRDGEEHGSAAWAAPRQVNAMFAQKENKLLTRNVRLGLDTHKHRRSLNVLVIGGSGAGKSRSYVKPNILEANTNYVVTDPKSEVLMATGGYLKRQGYDIRVLNLVNLEESDGYNPFRYLRDEKDALRLVNNLIQATTPKGSHSNDPFWEKSETALLQAIILMLFQEAPEYEQNFSMVMRVLEYAEVKEEDEEYDSPLDLLFQSIERERPDSVAVRQYKVFKLAAGKTAKSILVSTAVRLAPFNLPQIQAITDHDDMDLYTLGEQKCALYAVIPDNDSTFNFLVSLLYAQAFQALYYSADQIHHGPCLAMSTSCWMSLPLCPCRASPENWQPCAPETFQQAQLYKIWRKSRNYIRIRGRQSQATQTRFCTLAETKQQPISTFLRHLAKPRSIPKPMVSPRVDPGLGPPIFSRAVANC